MFLVPLLATVPFIVMVLNGVNSLPLVLVRKFILLPAALNVTRKVPAIPAKVTAAATSSTVMPPAKPISILLPIFCTDGISVTLIHSFGVGTPILTIGHLS